MSAEHEFMQGVDNLAIRTAGLAWLKLTRDAHIHERCFYLTDCVRRLGRRELRIFDVGCGSGLALYYLDSCVRGAVSNYLGIDMLSPDRLRSRYGNISIPHEFGQAYLDDDWNYGEFDLVWCAEVIEHLLDDRRLVKKLRSHLSPDGLLIVTTPSKVFVEKTGRFVPGYDAVSSTQDGGHVRTGYDLDMLRELGHCSGLALQSHAWLMPGNASDVRWHLNPHPSPIGTVARNVRDRFVRRCADFVLNGDPGLYADRYMTISATFAPRKNNGA